MFETGESQQTEKQNAAKRGVLASGRSNWSARTWRFQEAANGWIYLKMICLISTEYSISQKMAQVAH